MPLSPVVPEVIDAEYRGSQEASKGILGMLEVVLADFDRTMMMVTDAEQAAEDDFQTFQADLDRDTQSKEQSRTAKDGSGSPRGECGVRLQAGGRGVQLQARCFAHVA